MKDNIASYLSGSPVNVVGKWLLQGGW
jgi:hypothetical protein